VKHNALLRIVRYLQLAYYRNVTVPTEAYRSNAMFKCDILRSVYTERDRECSLAASAKEWSK